MIPNFDDDEVENSRIKFVQFIQHNKGIFDELFTRSFIKNNNSYMNLDSSKISGVQEGYQFFRNFNLGDDADVYSLTEDLNAFNTEDYQTDINELINLVQRYLRIPRVKKEFKKRFNEKLLSEINDQRDKLEEKRSKARTIKRTSEIKDELFDIDYVPDFRPDSVKGKLVRNVGETWPRTNLGGKKNGGKKKKNKTKKQRKSRKSKRQ
jgi:hypothetical protein